MPGFSSVAEYMRLLHEVGVILELCSTCSDNAYALQSVRNDASELREGITVTGMATVASRLDDVSTITF